MSASHQPDVRLAPGCVIYPILVMQGYMAVQLSYMAVKHSYIAVQQGYMLNSLWWVGWVRIDNCVKPQPELG